jgi:hypothetical protein
LIAAYPFDLWAALDRVANREQVVTGDAKAIRDALFGDALNDIVGHARRPHRF